MRRLFCWVLFFAFSMPLHPVSAADFPVKPITIVTPTRGGASDVMARIIGEQMGRILKTPFVIEPRPGAGGNIATASVAKANPDGHTLLFVVGTALTISPVLYKNVSFNPTNDFAAIGTVATTPYVLVVHPSVPVKSVQELVALAKTSGGKLNFGSAGNGTPNHIMGIQLNQAAGISLTHVPYSTTTAAMTDLIGGRIDVMFSSMPSALPYIKSGHIRPLAVAEDRRSALLPDVPTVGEVVKGYSFESWYGLAAPAGTPKDVIEKISSAAKEALNVASVRQSIAAQGSEIRLSTPEEMNTLVRSELARWGKIVKDNGIRID